MMSKCTDGIICKKESATVFFFIMILIAWSLSIGRVFSQYKNFDPHQGIDPPIYSLISKANQNYVFHIGNSKFKQGVIGGIVENGQVERIGRVGGMFLRGLALGDLDGDGINEIVVGDVSGKMRIYQFDGQTFVNKIAIKRDGTDYLRFHDRAYGIDIGDLDGDGKNELCVGDFSSQMIHLLAWTGSGYEQVDSVRVGYRALGLGMGDVNGDGKDELVCGTGGGDPSVKGNGVLRVFSWDPKTGFDEICSRDFGEEAYEIKVKDVDSDGQDEIMLGERDTYYLLKCDFDTLKIAWKYVGGIYSYDICAGDIDGNGIDDLLLRSNRTQALKFYKVQANAITELASLSIPLKPRFGTFGTTSIMEDLNGDGICELYVIDVSHYGSQLRGFALNSGTWSEFWSNSLGAGTDTLDMGNVDAIDWFSGLKVGDVTGNGKPELVAADFFGDIHVYSWDGGELSEIWRQNMGESSMGLLAGDIDGDGETEIIAGGRNGIVTVLDNANGKWEEVWRTHVGYYAFGSAYAIDIANLDNRGLPEIAVCGWQHDLHIYHFNPARQEYDELWQSNLTNFDAGNSYTRKKGNMAIGDVDGDNLPEIVVGDVAGVLHIIGWNGVSYEEKSSIETNTFYYWGERAPTYAVAIGNVIGDSLPEIIAGCSPGNLKIFSYSAGSFVLLDSMILEQRVYGEGTGLHAVAVGDVDNDGSAEIVAGTYDSLIVCDFENERLKWKWSKPYDQPYGLLIADLNGDGKNELIVGSEDGIVRFFFWEGQKFIPFGEIDIGQTAWSLVPIDLDNDGYTELLAGNEGGDVFSIQTDWLNFPKPNLRPSLSISITDGKESANPGERLTYRISYSNTGTAAATGVTVTDTIPDYTEMDLVPV